MKKVIKEYEHPHTTWAKSLKVGDKVKVRVVQYGAIKNTVNYTGIIKQVPEFGPTFMATEKFLVNIIDAPEWSEWKGQHWINVNALVKENRMKKIRKIVKENKLKKVIRNEIRNLLRETSLTPGDKLLIKGVKAGEKYIVKFIAQKDQGDSAITVADLDDLDHPFDIDLVDVIKVY